MPFFIDNQRYCGRPADRRSDAEEACYDFLDGLGLSYYRVDHDAADTIQDCLQVEAVLGSSVCKNLFLCNRQQTEFYLLSLPGGKPFKTKYLSAQIHSARLSFAGEGPMESLLGVHPGAVSILGLIHDKGHAVRLLLDTDLKDDPYFSCHPCRSTSTLQLRTADVLDKLLPALGVEPTWVTLPWEFQENSQEAHHG